MVLYPDIMRRVAFALAFFLFAPLLLASGVTVSWNPQDPTIGPYPTDALTSPDSTQKNGMRINLPMPDCTTAPGDCQDVQLISTASPALFRMARYKSRMISAVVFPRS